jgi:serine/threonine-protein kinase RsbW
MIEFYIKSKPENVALACSRVLSAASDAGMPENALMELELAVSEAVTNSIEHAYQWDENQEILITVTSSKDQLTVTIEDQGKPLPMSLFNDLDSNFEDPADESLLLEENGRGLKIIHALVDNIKINHNNGWNSLKLLKKF